MKRCEEFLNLYRDLEEYLAAKAGGSRTGLVQDFASKDGQRYREELDVFREMRNLLSHHGKIGNEYIVEPSDAAVALLREILEFAKNPPVAMQAAVTYDLLFKADYRDRVSWVAEKMEQRGFSHVPVVNANSRLVGVFSTGTLFSLLRSGEERDAKTLLLGDIAEIIKPEKHLTEQYAFVDSNATCYKIKKLFNSEGPDVRRVAAVFVTEGGKRNGTLLGMITPWDIIRLDSK